MEVLKAVKVVSSVRRGSSWPIVVTTNGGNYYVKLKGAGHGAAALVAEVLSASLAELIGLQVPSRALIHIHGDLLCENRDPELLELLEKSQGINLGLQVVKGARDFKPEDIKNVRHDEAACVVWLDWLIMNPDRTSLNPNMLIRKGKLWLIDHGSSLVFHHNWPGVDESSPSQPWLLGDHHILNSRTSNPGEWDRVLTDKISREMLQEAVNAIPDVFLKPLVKPHGDEKALYRRRQAYGAFLWKRLQSKRQLSDQIYKDVV